MDRKMMGRMALCVGINLVLGRFAAELGLPVYMDTVGTVLAVVLVRIPWVFVTAVLTSVLGSVVNSPYDIYYVGTQLTVAAVCTVLCAKGWFRLYARAIAAGAVVAVCAALVSAPVTVCLFEEISKSSTGAITLILTAAGHALWKSVLGGSLVVESLDKIIAVLVAAVVAKNMSNTQCT